MEAQGSSLKQSNGPVLGGMSAESKDTFTSSLVEANPRRVCIVDMADLCSQDKYVNSDSPGDFAFITEFLDKTIPSPPLVPDSNSHIEPTFIEEDLPIPVSKELVVLNHPLLVSDEWSDTQIYLSWVRQNMKSVSQILSVTFEGFEDQALALFAKLEKETEERWRTHHRPKNRRKNRMKWGLGN